MWASSDPRHKRHTRLWTPDIIPLFVSSYLVWSNFKSDLQVNNWILYGTFDIQTQFKARFNALVGWKSWITQESNLEYIDLIENSLEPLHHTNWFAFPIIGMICCKIVIRFTMSESTKLEVASEQEFTNRDHVWPFPCHNSASPILIIGCCKCWNRSENYTHSGSTPIQ